MSLRHALFPECYFWTATLAVTTCPNGNGPVVLRCTSWVHSYFKQFSDIGMYAQLESFLIHLIVMRCFWWFTFCHYDAISKIRGRIVGDPISNLFGRQFVISLHNLCYYFLFLLEIHASICIAFSISLIS